MSGAIFVTTGEIAAARAGDVGRGGAGIRSAKTVMHAMGSGR